MAAIQPHVRFTIRNAVSLIWSRNRRRYGGRFLVYENDIHDSVGEASLPIFIIMFWKAIQLVYQITICAIHGACRYSFFRDVTMANSAMVELHRPTKNMHRAHTHAMTSKCID